MRPSRTEPDWEKTSRAGETNKGYQREGDRKEEADTGRLAKVNRGKTDRDGYEVDSRLRPKQPLYSKIKNTHSDSLASKNVRHRNC